MTESLSQYDYHDTSHLEAATLLMQEVIKCDGVGFECLVSLAALNPVRSAFPKVIS
jgi:hypothetical protein